MLNTSEYISGDEQATPPSAQSQAPPARSTSESSSSHSLANLILPSQQPAAASLSATSGPPTLTPIPSTAASSSTQAPTQRVYTEVEDDSDEQGDEDYYDEDDDQQQHNHRPTTAKKRKRKDTKEPGKKATWTESQTLALLQTIYDFVAEHNGQMPASQQTGRTVATQRDWIEIARIMSEKDESLFAYELPDEVPDDYVPKWDQRGKTCALRWTNIKKYLRVSNRSGLLIKSQYYPTCSVAHHSMLMLLFSIDQKVQPAVIERWREKIMIAEFTRQKAILSLTGLKGSTLTQLTREAAESSVADIMSHLQTPNSTTTYADIKWCAEYEIPEHVQEVWNKL